MRCREMHGAVMVEVRCEERELKPTINGQGVGVSVPDFWVSGKTGGDGHEKGLG